MVEEIKKQHLKKRIGLVWLLAVLFLLVTGMVSAETLRMGILPVIDTLPLQVGVTEGYFKAENLDVQLISFSSAMERNTAMHSGQLAGSFMKAYARSVNALNQTPEKYRTLMTKTCRIPGNLVDNFPMYRYPAPRIPTQAEVQQVQDWMMEKGLLHEPIPYQRLIP